MACEVLLSLFLLIFLSGCGACYKAEFVRKEALSKTGRERERLLVKAAALEEACRKEIEKQRQKEEKGP